MPEVLNKIATGEYYAVALDLKYPDSEEMRVYAIDFINPYYNINHRTFRIRSLILQKEFNDSGIFYDNWCVRC